MENSAYSNKRPVEKTQKYMLLDWLTKGKKVTVPIASRQLLIGSLPRRIKDLKDLGYPIKSQKINYKRADGDGTLISEYWMEPEHVQMRDEHLKNLKERLSLHARQSNCPTK
ncbi:hypothetical protein SDC9_17653 [bioreactor metagenome]|uniref:Winged helix-turn-helix domain-containing protein n=1 Tax=bioreactor metagenome TaxID=1076179 RepID=A0A644TY70_9ZZZZ|nr:helix-turn-helix domain-containing protein [Lentimicrobium sp.]MEA5111709.1 helix-turn-helix domain-containing protein [Lentimicrobium sp.]